MWRPGLRRWVAGLVLLCVLLLALLSHHIAVTVPYPRHPDEPFVSGPAETTLKTGNWHPRDFNYPSLPKYLATAGMAAGFVRGAARGEVASTGQLHNFGFPYYDHPTIMRTARQLFALLGVIGVGATGVSAWLLVRRRSAVLFAPLLLAISPLYFTDSWRYLNVDIVAACFASATLAAALYATYRPSLGQSAILPGALAGLATASKYTLAVTFAPVLLGILFYLPRQRRVLAATLGLAAMVGAFVIAVPYSVLALPTFLNGVAAEAFHYASGHRGRQAAPGLEQALFYGRHFLGDFGVALPVAVVGAIVLFRQDWRRAAVASAYPLALLLLLLNQRVQFARNVLSVHPMLAICAAAGTLALYDGLLRLVKRRTGQQTVGLGLRAALGFVLFLLVTPVWHLPGHLRDQTDSRNLAVAWMAGRLPEGWAVVVPSELAFDARPLEAAGHRVVRVDLQPARDVIALQQVLADVQSPAAMLVPRWGADPRYPGAELASQLNGLTASWRVLERFGTHDVLVNYAYPTPDGDPAFGVAIVK